MRLAFHLAHISAHAALTKAEPAVTNSRRMSFTKDVTPCTARAIAVAQSISPRELTKPLSCTRPLQVDPMSRFGLDESVDKFAPQSVQCRLDHL